MSNTHRCCNPGFRSSRLSQAIKGILLASALTASVAAHGDESTRRNSYHISGGSLGQALSQFARDAGILFTGESKLTDGKISKGLEGEYTVEEGFRKLLAGSGLTYSITNDNAVAIKVAEFGSDAASTLPAVRVEGKAGYDASDPYNPDYSLPNASTATKTDTPIMETPYSVKTVPKQVMEDQQVIRIEKALQNVAGVVQEASSGSMRDSFTIRGFSTGNDILNYRNGVPFPEGIEGFSTKRDVANLERIEVLKGPGSLLFGRAEPGGIINVVTKQPLETPYYSLQQQFGSFDFYRTALDATGPVNKNNDLLYRVNLAYENADSFSDLINRDRVFVAPVIKWDISPRTQVTLELEYQHFDEAFGATIPPIGSRPASVPRNSNFAEPDFNSIKGDRVLAGFNWSHNFNDQWKLSQNFFYNSIDSKQNNSVIQTRADIDGTVARDFIKVNGESESYFTSVNLTGKINTSALKHTLLFGGDYFRGDDKDIQPVDFRRDTGFNVFNPIKGTSFNNLASLFSFTRNQTRSWYGLYFQDQIELPYNFFVLGGVRYDQADSQDNISNSETGNEDRVSPRGGLLWRPIPELSLYYSYTENFGAANGVGLNGQTLPPQTAQQWEVGAKTEMLDGRFNASIAYFDLTKQNIADQFNTFFQRAIGEAESRGVELDVAGELLPGWRVIGGYSYLDFAKITRDVGFDGGIGNEGNLLPNTARHSGSLFTTYEFKDGGLNGLKLGGGAVSVSQRQGNSANTYQIPGHTLVNLLASYSTKIGMSKLTLQLNIDNLLDKTYFAGSSGGNSSFFGAPRTFLGSVRIEY